MHFQHVKLDLFDKLVLVGYMPDRVVVWLWNTRTGLTRSGKTTDSKGHKIVLCASTDFIGGTNTCSSLGRHLASLPFDEGDVWVRFGLDTVPSLESRYLTRVACLYSGSPFATMAPSSRGFMMDREIARPVYEAHFGAGSDCSEQSILKNGGRGHGKYDFEGPNSRKLECKSSQLSGLSYLRTFRFFWRDVKLSHFDELLLIGYLPDRLVIWMWDTVTGLCTSGKLTDCAGHGMQLYGFVEPESGAWHTSSKAPGRLLASLRFSDLKP